MGNLDDVWPSVYGNSSPCKWSIPHPAGYEVPVRTERVAGLTWEILEAREMWVGEGGGRVLDYPYAPYFVKRPFCGAYS